MPTVSRWYRSKVDAWIAVTLAIAPLVCVAALLVAVVTGKGVWAAAIPSLVIVAVYGGLVWPMRYGIDDDVLVVRHGVVRQRIRIGEIVEVHPTRSPFSSPALSLDRLNIRFGEGYFKSAMISPEDRSAFLDELAARARLRRDGERLVRD